MVSSKNKKVFTSFDQALKLNEEIVAGLDKMRSLGQDEVYVDNLQKWINSKRKSSLNTESVFRSNTLPVTGACSPQDLDAPKFTQLLSTTSGLFALAIDGTVWVYVKSPSEGWKPLGMRRVPNERKVTSKKYDDGGDDLYWGEIG